MIEYESNPITWNKNTRTFSTEASSIEEFRSGMPEKFDLRVKKSGNVKTFAHRRASYDRDGDITRWTYTALDGGFTFSTTRTPLQARTKLTRARLSFGYTNAHASLEAQKSSK